MKTINTLIVTVILASSGCTTIPQKNSEAPSNGGLIGTAESYGIIPSRYAELARKAKEIAFGKDAPNPVEGWEYKEGMKYVGDDTLIQNAKLEPSDIEAWARYEKVWKPFVTTAMTATEGVPVIKVPQTPIDSEIIATNEVEQAVLDELTKQFENMLNAEGIE